PSRLRNETVDMALPSLVCTPAILAVLSILCEYAILCRSVPGARALVGRTNAVGVGSLAARLRYRLRPTLCTRRPAPSARFAVDLAADALSAAARRRRLGTTVPPCAATRRHVVLSARMYRSTESRATGFCGKATVSVVLSSNRFPHAHVIRRSAVAVDTGIQTVPFRTERNPSYVGVRQHVGIACGLSDRSSERRQLHDPLKGDISQVDSRIK